MTPAEAIEKLSGLDKAATKPEWEAVDGYVGATQCKFLVRPGIPDGVLFRRNVERECDEKDIKLTAAARNALPALLECARALANIRLCDRRGENPYGHECRWCAACCGRSAKEADAALSRLAESVGGTE